MSGTKGLTFNPLFSTITDMAKIPLYGKRGIGKYALVDDEDVEKVAGIRWHVSDMGYAVNRSGKNTTRMHRVINNTPDGLVTDHKNHNQLDNRKFNLRTITASENAKYRKGTKGYCWDSARHNWMVRYKNTFYGRYRTEQEAQEAYKLARSGVPYNKTKRKLWHLPTGVSKQFGKYRVRPQKGRIKYWLGAFATLDEAKAALKKWQEKG